MAFAAQLTAKCKQVTTIADTWIKPRAYYCGEWWANKSTKRLRVRDISVPPNKWANLLLILELLALDIQEVGLHHSLRLEELLRCRIEQSVHLHSKAPSFSSHKEREQKVDHDHTQARTPTDLQSPGRAKLRERVGRAQPLRLRPRIRCRRTLLGVLPEQHREEHAVASREALDLRHGWLVGASPTAAR